LTNPTLYHKKEFNFGKLKTFQKTKKVKLKKKKLKSKRKSSKRLLNKQTKKKNLNLNLEKVMLLIFKK
jgi:hypothetical protein